MKSLACLEIGQWGEVATLLSTGSMRRRMLDLGIIKGTKIQCLMKSPFGDPVAFLIRGTIIALRKEDSHNVLIHTLTPFEIDTGGENDTSCFSR